MGHLTHMLDSTRIEYFKSLAMRCAVEYGEEQLQNMLHLERRVAKTAGAHSETRQSFERVMRYFAQQKQRV